VRLRIISLLLFFVSGCADADDVSGLWQTPLDVSAVSAGALSNDLPVRFRLAAGQYGKDVSGVLLLFSDDLFHSLEACRYLETAEVRDGHLLFSVAGAGNEKLDVELLLGDFEGDEALQGTMTGQGDSIPIVLVRQGDGGDIHEEGLDLGCPQR